MGHSACPTEHYIQTSGGINRQARREWARAAPGAGKKRQHVLEQRLARKAALRRRKVKASK